VISADVLQPIGTIVAERLLALPSLSA